MENKLFPSKTKLLFKKEEKDKYKTDNNFFVGNTGEPKTKVFLEILKKDLLNQEFSQQRFRVSIKPKVPTIKTIYIAEKSRFNSSKQSSKSGAIGDYCSHIRHCSKNISNIVKPVSSNSPKGKFKTDNKNFVQIQATNVKQDPPTTSICLQSPNISQDCIVYRTTKNSVEKCFGYTRPQLSMNLPKENLLTEKQKKCDKIDNATSTVINPNSTDTLISTRIVNKLRKKINYLERKVLRQEMVFRSIDPNLPLSSSDEESKEILMRTVSITCHAGCSYIEQYSHVPETSAFQRYAQQSSPVSARKTNNLEKEHNSEQYGRDFTAYDGITARGRRQTSSVPGRRNDVPKVAAERVHKIRHKLNPVRDYRLMDTVHYLAQGEFAPRDDGIKLTPSREAVLSDIIWEDVCRTHWPNARLGRRQHTDRCNTRFELQRLIDNLLRERVAHVERRKRRHYRIVKLNHRQENCRPLGKTGDIIVASHKSRQSNEDRDVAASDKNNASVVLSNRRHDERYCRRKHKSHDRLTYPLVKRKTYEHEEPSPGPSSAVYNAAHSKAPTCCYHTSNLNKTKNYLDAPEEKNIEPTSGSSASVNRSTTKSPRLLVKKDSLRRKHTSKNEPDLEHFILLPTLVVRTPSNVKRQKKFNELYHRVLNNGQNCPESNRKAQPDDKNVKKKNVGLNVNVTLSNSEQL